MTGPSDQASFESLDISRWLRLLMVNHRLGVKDLADMAGVSKSAMEKYLAGPSSPRATAIASLARRLNVPADFILFGELKIEEALLFEEAHLAMTRFLRDLFTAEELSGLEVGSKDWMSKAEMLAFDRAWRFRSSFLRELESAKRAGAKISIG